MQGSDHDRRIEEFEARLRTWGGRPPSLASAVAANRVVGRLPERSAALPWLRLAAVTAMLVFIALAAWFGSSARPGPVAATVAVATSDDVVQFWLDPETPVYFVLPPFGGETGEKT